MPSKFYDYRCSVERNITAVFDCCRFYYFYSLGQKKFAIAVLNAKNLNIFNFLPPKFSNF